MMNGQQPIIVLKEGTRREKEIHKIAIEKCGFYLPPKSRYDYLLTLPEEEDIDKEIMRIALIAELDAISLYEQLAAMTKNETLKKILLDVAKEEKTHAGEFLALLLKLDPEQIKELDFKILRLLSYDADISQRELARKFMVEPTEVWRRVHFLEDYVLTGYRAKINRTFFNVTSNKLLFLTFEDENLLISVFAALCDEKNRPPFRYTLEVVEDESKNKHLMMFVSLPQYHEANMCYAFNDLGTVKMLNLDTTGSNSVTYAFYEKNYDFRERRWHLNKDYVVNQPIKTLKLN